MRREGGVSIRFTFHLGAVHLQMVDSDIAYNVPMTDEIANGLARQLADALENAIQERRRNRAREN